MFQIYAPRIDSRYIGVILAQMDSETQLPMHDDGHADSMGDMPTLKHLESIYA